MKTKSSSRLQVVSERNDLKTTLSPLPVHDFTFADFYAGIGGFHLAFHALGARCVLAAEKDVPARKTYEHNFRSISPGLFEQGDFYRDVSDLADAPDCLPDFEILCAGFPCQSFSVAGKQRGFDDPRNGEHFFLLAEIIEAKRPEAFFLENVQGLTHRNMEEVFRTIQRTIDELGYSFHWKIIRACDHGIPQLRPRLYMVGFKHPETEFRFPDPIPLTMTMSDIFGAPCHRDIGKTVLTSFRNKRFGQPFNWDCYLVEGKERWLTPKEVIQMMGFPKWFQFPVHESHTMKQLGNSVAVPAIRAVAREIITALEGHRMRNHQHLELKQAA